MGSPITNIATTDDGERFSGRHVNQVRHRKKIAYKADVYGVPLVYVDPAYTSQTCSQCGCVDKASRKSQSVFLCTQCGFSAHADENGAVNIGLRGTASINAPYAVGDLGFNPA